MWNITKGYKVGIEIHDDDDEDDDEVGVRMISNES